MPPSHADMQLATQQAGGAADMATRPSSKSTSRSVNAARTTPSPLAHLYTQPVRPVAYLSSASLTSEQRFRQRIQLALRDALTGEHPLEQVAVRGFRVESTGVVVYDVVVFAAEGLRWVVTRRFSEFASFNAQLESLVPDVETLPPIPSKEWRLLVDHLSSEFLAQRLAVLDNFCRRLVGMPQLRTSSELLDFLKPTLDDKLDDPVCRYGGSTATRMTRSTRGAGEGGRAQGRAGSPSRVGGEHLTSSSPSASTTSQSFDSDAEEEGHSYTPSSSLTDSRRTSHSQVYEPAPPSPPFGAAMAAQAASPPTIPSEVSSVSIPCTQVLRGDHVVFQIHVRNDAKLAAFSRWTILKRFDDFAQLDRRIRAQIRHDAGTGTAGGGGGGGVEVVLGRLPLLPKRASKVLVNHLAQRFIERRRLLLEVYLKKIIVMHETCNMDCVLDFLGCN